MSKLDDIAARNERALRDTRHKLLWVAAIVLALVAVGIALAAGLGVPKTPPRPVTPTGAHEHVPGVLLRSAPAPKDTH